MQNSFAPVLAVLILFLVGMAHIAFLSRISRISSAGLRKLDIACYAFLLAPISISWVLWLGMLVFPGRISSLGYVIGVPSIALLMIVLFWSSLMSYLADAIREFRSLRQATRRLCVVCAVVAALVFVAVLVWANIASAYHMDMSEYMLGGDWFAHVRDTTYHQLVSDVRNGFWYHAYHSYCLPLFATWGCFLNDVFGGVQDWYYRFVIMYYWMGVNLAILLFFSRTNLGWSYPFLACAIAVFNSMPFVWGTVPTCFNCDHVRVSLVMAIAWALWWYVESPRWNACIVVGLLSAAGMLVHGMSVLFIGLLLCSLPFAKASVRTKALHMVLVLAIVFAVAGTHYLLQAFYGDGWLLEKRRGVATYELFADQPSDVADNGVLHGPSNASNPLSALGASNDGPDWRRKRFGSFWHLLFEGYLGQFFNIRRFSISGLFPLLGMLLLLGRWRRLRTCHKAVVVSGAGIAVVIALVFYYNFRYQFTLLPLMIASTFCLMGQSSKGQLWLGGSFRRQYKFIIALCFAVGVYGSKLGSHFMDVEGPQATGNLLSRVCLKIRTCPATLGSCLKMAWRDVHPCRPSPLWPKEGGRPRVIFSDYSKIFYRHAPYPVWFCDCVSSGVGPKGYCGYQRSSLARRFDYFVLSRRLLPKSVPEVFNPDDWELVQENESCLLYCSRHRPGGNRHEEGK